MPSANAMICAGARRAMRSHPDPRLEFRHPHLPSSWRIVRPLRLSGRDPGHRPRPRIDRPAPPPVSPHRNARQYHCSPIEKYRWIMSKCYDLKARARPVVAVSRINPRGAAGMDRVAALADFLAGARDKLLHRRHANEGAPRGVAGPSPGDGRIFPSPKSPFGPLCREGYGPFGRVAAL